MANKPIIPNAMNIAEEVAKIMFEFSYRSTQFEGIPVEYQAPAEQIDDVLLFGSTVRGEPAHDIDMLIIHNLSELFTYGIITKYDEHKGEAVPDLDAKIEDKRYQAISILDSMGSPRFADYQDEDFELGDALLNSTRKLRDTFDPDYYEGEVRTIELAEGLNIEMTISREFVREDYDRAHEAIRNYLSQDMVRTKIKEMFDRLGMEINTTLDLHVMSAQLLSPGKTEDVKTYLKKQRQLAVTQCRDSTFWPSVLESGRLYNRETGKFDTMVSTKYEKAIELFTIN